jgi:CheY-like chemotaxis protein
MAERSLLCIEPETATVTKIKRAFDPYGFRVESIPNGEQAIEWARTNTPALIVLSVEPRKVGYAICNKLKRSPSLREIPLILISGEETMATFEQHRKLKSRAEEYLLKPLDTTDLLAKADRLVGLGVPSEEIQADSADIEIADDDISEISQEDLGEPVLEADAGDDEAVSPETGAQPDDTGQGEIDDSLELLGELSKPSAALDENAPSPFQEAATAPSRATAEGGEVPFDAEQFDQETQAAFAALEAGAAEGGTPAPSLPSGRGREAPAGRSGSEDMVDLRSLWADDELPARMEWEEPPESTKVSDAPPEGALDGESGFSDASASAGRKATGGAAEGGDDPAASQVTPPPASAAAFVGEAGSEDALLAGLGTADEPPLPEEVLYDERAREEAAARDQRIADLSAKLESVHAERQAEKQATGSRTSELQGRIESLEAERQTLRKELDEQRERMTQAANQGAFSQERDRLGLREIINRKEKDILDLRDALDAKERQILDHKDKIREHERARRDLEEQTLGFEKSLVAANERVSELARDKEKSAEREKGLKARLDDAHEELRKSQDEIEALRRRIAQGEEKGRAEVERTRAEWEAKLAETEEAQRVEAQKQADDRAATEAALVTAHQIEMTRSETTHRAEVEGLQRRLAEEVATSADRLGSEVNKLRREHDKTVASLKEEQALQLASERQSYEVQTEAKQRAQREEIMALRRRHEEELASAEERRQRDVGAEEQRRLTELEQAETRRRAELQSRDEEHHGRVTEAERRHLIEKTEMTERHRLELDQALGRAARAEGELAARAQEIEQAYRRLAGFEADLDAVRAELGDREVKLAQARDRVGELETKLADYEDQVVRAYQRLRSDEKTTEKVRRALAVALTLLDERAAGAAAAAPLKTGAAASEEAEKS